MPKTQSRAGVNYYAHGMFAMELEPSKDPETKLWQAVLGQTFEDAFGPARYEKTVNDRRDAQVFLTDYSADSFVTVCENAGFDPSFVKKRVEKTIDQNQISRDYLLNIKQEWSKKYAK